MLVYSQSPHIRWRNPYVIRDIWSHEWKPKRQHILFIPRYFLPMSPSYHHLTINGELWLWSMNMCISWFSPCRPYLMSTSLLNDIDQSNSSHKHIVIGDNDGTLGDKGKPQMWCYNPHFRNFEKFFKKTYWHLDFVWFNLWLPLNGALLIHVHIHNKQLYTILYPYQKYTYQVRRPVVKGIPIVQSTL